MYGKFEAWLSIAYNNDILLFLNRREKQAIEATGSPSDWEIFNDVDRLLDPDKSFNPDDLPMEHINSM